MCGGILLWKGDLVITIAIVKTVCVCVCGGILLWKGDLVVIAIEMREIDRLDVYTVCVCVCMCVCVVDFFSLFFSTTHQHSNHYRSEQ